jgi:hypothetical protein
MKMMHGLFCLACSNRSRTRLAPDADEHLHEVRPRDREERHPRLAGDGAREQGLAGTGRADQQGALGYPRAEALELLGGLEKLLDLGELLDGLVGARDVRERHLGRVFGHALGAALAEAHHPVAAALHAAHQEEEE